MICRRRSRKRDRHSSADALAHSVSRGRIRQALDTVLRRLLPDPLPIDTLLRAVPDFLWSAEVDVTGEVQSRYYSPAADHIVGRPLMPLIGDATRWVEVVHPEDRAAMRAAVGRLTGGVSDHEEIEGRLLTDDGTARWVRSRMHRRALGDGRVRYYGVVSDISERVRTTSALQASETRYRDLVELSPDGIGVHRDLCLVFINRAGARLLGAGRPSDLIGQSIFDFAHPDDRTTLVTRAVRALEHDARPDTAEHRFVRLDGGILTVAVTLLPFGPAAEGALQVVLRDVTAHRQAIAALQASEERYRALFENARDVIYVLDLDGYFVDVNPAAKRVTGYDENDARRMHLAQVVVPEDLLRLRALLADSVAARPTPTTIETEICAKDGHRVPVEVSTRALLRDGKPFGFLGVARDVSERHQAARELRAMNETLERRVRERTAELEALNQDLEAFSASVSHDLRAPLRTIDGFSCALLEDGADRLDAETLSHVHRIRGAAHLMTERIEALLTLAHAGWSALTYEAVDLTALAHSVVAELRERNPSRAVTISVEDGLTTTGDLRLLRAVVENLLANAWKYTAPNDPAQITVGMVREPAQPIFFVRDNGVGFDEAHGDRLFRPFGRLHSREEFEGVGIGLATAQRVIQRHGGRIWATSARGRGAAFFFTLASDHPSPDGGDE